ncbi:MAG: rhomboid family intramembrane serine protease [candidate division Zixibacteria bacterium]|nr:rhomboid family intramembrane serine protease [candidate division Zixibacteria bacterium]
MNYNRPSFRFGGGALPPVIKYLLIANAAVFFLQIILPRDFIYYFGLVPAWVSSKFAIWQFGTYMFLHGGFFHILFNMFALWMFGSDIERSWGSREFLKYYFLCGIGAGVINYLFAMGSSIPVIGASGAVYGILVAYAMLFPNRVIYIYFLFPVKAKYLVMAFAAIEFISTWNRSSDGVAHFAHLGGMLVGFLYLKSDWRMPNLFGKMKSSVSSKKKKKEDKKKRREEEILDKVDEILDKINKIGYHNLSDEEKKILSEASQILSGKKE